MYVICLHKPAETVVFICENVGALAINNTKKQKASHGKEKFILSFWLLFLPHKVISPFHHNIERMQLE